MLIRGMVRDDIPAVLQITDEGFKDDELVGWIYPYRDRYPEDLRRAHLFRLRSRLVAVGTHAFVAVTEQSDPEWNGTPEIVGYTMYMRTGQDEGSKEWTKDSWTNKIERYLVSWEELYEGIFFDRAISHTRVKSFEKTRNYGFYSTLNPRWHLRMFGVAPKYQRRGIGGKLLKHGQEIARKDDLPITLEASAAARGLYAKCGFKVVDETEVADGVHCVAMVWEPEEREGKWLEDQGDGRAKVKESH